MKNADPTSLSNETSVGLLSIRTKYNTILTTENSKNCNLNSIRKWKQQQQKKNADPTSLSDKTSVGLLSIKIKL